MVQKTKKSNSSFSSPENAPSAASQDPRFNRFGKDFSDDDEPDTLVSRHAFERPGGVDSDSNHGGSSDSEDEREVAELASRSAVRRVRRSSSDDSDTSSDDEEQDDVADGCMDDANDLSDEEEVDDHNTDDDDDAEDTNDDSGNPDVSSSTPKKVIKPLSLASLKKFQNNLDKTGVIYLSRVPPFMKPQKLRSLLSKYGQIGRVYLNPEDARITAKRKKYKHNRRQNYTEGWVEFLEKDVAKRVANTLNKTNIGGKKSSRFYDDMWNMKYLPRFKWIHLTEQLAYELKVREQKIKTEMAQAKRENKVYLKNVEKAKMIEAIQERKMSKRKASDMDTLADGATNSTSKTDNGPGGLSDDVIRIKRAYKQRKVVDSEARTRTKPSSSKLSVLSKIFT